MSDGLGSFSMLDLFRQEVEDQLSSFTEGMLKLEQEPGHGPTLDGLMRASHSLKGAARLVGVRPAEKLAHAMEDCLVAAQQGQLHLDPVAVDRLLKAGDQLRQLASMPEAELQALDDEWPAAGVASLKELLEAPAPPPPAPKPTPVVVPVVTAPSAPEPEPEKVAPRTLRLDADRLDSLLNLAGEAQVMTGWLQQYSSSLGRLRTRHLRLQRQLGEIDQLSLETRERIQLQALVRASEEQSVDLAERVTDLASYDRRISALTGKLYEEVVASRMRPFADGVQGFKRMVRDVARQLGKEAELELSGLDVLVDREILERLESPLGHLLRNAVDHGLETPEERLAVGKSPRGSIRVEAFHRGGMLCVVVEDDGRGLDTVQLRQRLVEKGLVAAETSQQLALDELVQFLYLPGFSSRTEVTEISGRGVGLDVVRSAVQEMGGMLGCEPTPGLGMKFSLRLPVTLSVVQCLLVGVQGEAYALPLSRLERVDVVQLSDVRELDGRPYLADNLTGLAWCQQVLDLAQDVTPSPEFPVVSLSNGRSTYGLVVDRLLGKQKLVVQRLDVRLGRIPNVSSGAILEDGSAALILDVDDLLRSLEKTFETQRGTVLSAPREESAQDRKRVLVVDDSITVREVERNLLELLGYEVDVAVDGVDGWHAVRRKDYDLIVSDLDMPRMDGFELVSNIKNDPLLRTRPVIVVSYKDREEDRLRALQVGADFFLTKGSFQDETFTQAVLDLIG